MGLPTQVNQELENTKKILSNFSITKKKQQKDEKELVARRNFEKVLGQTGKRYYHEHHDSQFSRLAWAYDRKYLVHKKPIHHLPYRIFTRHRYYKKQMGQRWLFALVVALWPTVTAALPSESLLSGLRIVFASNNNYDSPKSSTTKVDPESPCKCDNCGGCGETDCLVRSLALTDLCTCIH